MALALLGCASKYSAKASEIIPETTPLTSPFPSFAFVCPSN